MIRVFSMFFVIVLLSGCSILGNDVDPIDIQTTEKTREPLDLTEPEPLEPNKVEWHVITPDNIDKKFNELSDSKVLFGITPSDYENFSLNAVETRNLIASLKKIINEYKDYYETDLNSD